MIASILTSTKKNLGLDQEYDHFDADIVMYINAVFSTLSQIGVSPGTRLFIEDKAAVWEDLFFEEDIQQMVRAFTYLRVRMLFDPPGTAFLLNAMNEQMREYEWRIREYVEGRTWKPPTVTVSSTES